MKAFKLITGILILLIIGLFLSQNASTFVSPLQFQLNLYIKEHLQWTLRVYTVLLLAGIAGLFLGIVLMLRPYFNVRRLLAQERQEHRRPPSIEVVENIPGPEPEAKPKS
jgi:uncharacterized integral membrane protein